MPEQEYTCFRVTEVAEGTMGKADFDRQTKNARPEEKRLSVVVRCVTALDVEARIARAINILLTAAARHADPSEKTTRPEKGKLSHGVPSESSPAVGEEVDD